MAPAWDLAPAWTEVEAAYDEVGDVVLRLLSHCCCCSLSTLRLRLEICAMLPALWRHSHGCCALPPSLPPSLDTTGELGRALTSQKIKIITDNLIIWSIIFNNWWFFSFVSDASWHTFGYLASNKIRFFKGHPWMTSIIWGLCNCWINLFWYFAYTMI